MILSAHHQPAVAIVYHAISQWWQIVVSACPSVHCTFTWRRIRSITLPAIQFLVPGCNCGILFSLLLNWVVPTRAVRIWVGVAHARQGVYTATELRQYRPFMGDKYCSSPSGPHGLETNHPGLYWGKKHTVLIDIFCVIGIFFFDVVTLSWEWWAALIPNPSPYVRSVEKVWQTIKSVSIMNSFVIIMP